MGKQVVYFVESVSHIGEAQASVSETVLRIYDYVIYFRVIYCFVSHNDFY